MGAICCKAQEVDYVNGEITLRHFHVIRAIGKGSFGKVSIVRHRLTQNEYALKYINKQRCIQQRAVSNIIGERNLLERINYPLIVNLCYAFQDDNHLFMALDLMLGGDLRYLLNNKNTLSELQVRFYVAEIALSINYLQKHRIAHRDIKPENVLLDEAGHAHLGDFNVAVTFTDKRPFRKAAGGTIPYMAPEIHAQTGYAHAVDWWSLGILTYELLFGKRPFTGSTDEEIISAILHQPLAFPDNVHELVSHNCTEVISKLLQKSPDERLCKLEDLQCLPWFHGLDWEALENKQSVPPFLPNANISNFDAIHEIEEVFLNEPTLLVARKATFPVKLGEDQSMEEAQELRTLERRFLPFDRYRRQSQGAADDRHHPGPNYAQTQRLHFDHTKNVAQGYKILATDASQP